MSDKNRSNRSRDNRRRSSSREHERSSSRTRTNSSRQSYYHDRGRNNNGRLSSDHSSHYARDRYDRRSVSYDLDRSYDSHHPMLQRERIDNTLFHILSDLVESRHVANRFGNNRGHNSRNSMMLPPLQGQENHRYRWSMEDYRSDDWRYNSASRRSNSYKRRNYRSPVKTESERKKKDYKSTERRNNNDRRPRSKNRTNVTRTEHYNHTQRTRAVSNIQSSPE